jgi:hypothetical protein
MTHYLISKEDAEIVRAALTGNALHTFDSGLHVTPFAPFDHSGPVDAKTFNDEVLSPAASLANGHQIAFYGLAVGVAFDKEEETLAVDSVASVTQLGHKAEYRTLLKDVLGEEEL